MKIGVENLNTMKNNSLVRSFNGSRGFFAVTLLFAINVLFNALTLFFFEDKFVAFVVGTCFGMFLYFKYVFQYLTIIVPANRALVMQNSFITETNESSDDPSTRKVVGQKEYQAGFYFMFPWDTKVGDEIDMGKDTLIESDESVVYTTKNGQQIVIKWIISTRPLEGHLIQYKMVEPEAREARIRARAESFLINFIGDKDDVDFGTKLTNDIGEGFEKIYGGDKKIDDEEEELGVWTGKPKIVAIMETADRQKARTQVAKLEEIIRKASELESELGIERGKALELAYLLLNGGNVDVLNLVRK